MNDETIWIDDASAIEHPDEIAKILVKENMPPTHLAVEQQNLEEYFMQLTGGAK